MNLSAIKKRGLEILGKFVFKKKGGRRVGEREDVSLVGVPSHCLALSFFFFLFSHVRTYILLVGGFGGGFFFCWRAVGSQIFMNKVRRLVSGVQGQFFFF